MLRWLVLCHCTPPPSLSSVLHLEVDMASKNPSDNTFLFFLIFFFFFSMVFICALCRPGFAGQVAHTNFLPPNHGSRSPEMATTEGSWRWRDRSTRRLMIGSTAPTCTYNECKGCRLKCRAEQVPVDAGDPMNSAYRYRCVCHG